MVAFSSSLSLLSLKKAYFLADAFLATAVLGLAMKFMWSIVPSAVTPPAVSFYPGGLRGETCGLGTILGGGPSKAAGLINALSSAMVFGFSSASAEVSFFGAGFYVASAFSDVSIRAGSATDPGCLAAYLGLIGAL